MPRTVIYTPNMTIVNYLVTSKTKRVNLNLELLRKEICKPLLIFSNNLYPDIHFSITQVEDNPIARRKVLFLRIIIA